MTSCAGSEVYADGPLFDFQAVCPGCYQLVQVRPDGGSFRFLSHQRPVVSNSAEDALYTVEFDDEGKAA